MGMRGSCTGVPGKWPRYSGGQPGRRRVAKFTQAELFAMSAAARFYPKGEGKTFIQYHRLFDIPAASAHLLQNPENASLG